MWFTKTLVGQIFHVPTGPSSTHIAKTILAKDENTMRTVPDFSFTCPITVWLNVELPQTDCTMPSALVNLNNAMKGRSGLPGGSRFVVVWGIKRRKGGNNLGSSPGHILKKFHIKTELILNVLTMHISAGMQKHTFFGTPVSIIVASMA